MHKKACIDEDVNNDTDVNLEIRGKVGGAKLNARGKDAPLVPPDELVYCAVAKSIMESEANNICTLIIY